MFTQNNLDEGIEETFRQFFSVQLDGFFEDQFNKLTNNFFIDCVCRHCGYYIKYVSLRALLIHAIGCSRQKLQMEKTKNISLEQVEVIEIPFMQCGQDLNILNALAEIKSILIDKDQDSDDLEENQENNEFDNQIVGQTTQVKENQQMPIEEFNYNDFRQQIISVTGFSYKNASRFVSYINDGKSSRSTTYDKAIETKKGLKQMVQQYWRTFGIADPRSKQSQTQKVAKSEIKNKLQVMHRPDFFKTIEFIEIRNLKLQSKHNLWRNYQQNNQHFKHQKHKKKIINQQQIINFLYFTGADIYDLPYLTQEMFQINLYHYTTQETKVERNFSLHPDDHNKLQELIRRLKYKKLITNICNLAFGDNPDVIKTRFNEEIKSGPNPLLTLESIKACRACEIYNFNGKESVTSHQIKEFFGHNSLGPTIKYLADYSKIYHVSSQPFSCPSTGKFINKNQQK